MQATFEQELAKVPGQWPVSSVARLCRVGPFGSFILGPFARTVTTHATFKCSACDQEVRREVAAVCRNNEHTRCRSCMSALVQSSIDAVTTDAVDACASGNGGACAVACPCCVAKGQLPAEFSLEVWRCCFGMHAIYMEKRKRWGPRPAVSFMGQGDKAGIGVPLLKTVCHRQCCRTLLDRQ